MKKLFNDITFWANLVPAASVLVIFITSIINGSYAIWIIPTALTGLNWYAVFEMIKEAYNNGK